MPKQPLDWKGKNRQGSATTVIGSVVVLLENSERVGAVITNNGANVMYLAKGDPAIVGAGIPLYPNGGVHEINLTNPYYGPLSIASLVAGDNISWSEQE